MDTLLKVIDTSSDFVWNVVLIWVLIFTGLYFTIRLGVPQFTRLTVSFKHAFGGIFKKKGKKSGKQGISSFQALATAVAAQIGTGNIGGVATALVSGGPGAIFWMWISGILGMSTIFAEAVLAQKFKQKDTDGTTYGGPSYYLSQGLPNKALGRTLAVLFSILIIIALGFCGNMVQSNSIGLAMKTFNVPPLVTGIVIAILAALIFIGGIKRISRFAEMVVPFMAVLYLIASVIILCLNASQIGPILAMIFKSAFTTKAVVGGVAGSAMKAAMRYGIARGLFSNEAGMGSTPHAHAVAAVDHPVQQGYAAMAGVVVDTLLVCTATALTILLTGAPTQYPDLTSVELTAKSFHLAFGNFGEIFLSVALLFFSFTTVIGWYYFGESNIKYLFKGQAAALWAYRLIVVACIIVGATLKVELVWSLSDFFNGLMVLPNAIGILWLSPLVIQAKKEYETLTPTQQYSDVE